jgi:hypothetical protein
VRSRPDDRLHRSRVPQPNLLRDARERQTSLVGSGAIAL